MIFLTTHDYDIVEILHYNIQFAQYPVYRDYFVHLKLIHEFSLTLSHYGRSLRGQRDQKQIHTRSSLAWMISSDRFPGSLLNAEQAS